MDTRINPDLMRRLDEALQSGEPGSEATTPEIDRLVRAVNEQGHATATALLMHLYREDDASYNAISAVVSALIRRCGANPLRWEGDFTDMSMALAWTTTCELVTMEEEGAGLRTAQGGNYLHALASKNSVLLRQFGDSNKQTNRTSHPAWMTQLTDEGDSVLHVLWKYAGSQGSGQDVDVWADTEWLLGQGQSLDGRNRAGQDVVDLVGVAIERHPKLLDVQLSEEMERARATAVARWQARSLESQTPGAGGARSSLRL